MRNIEYTEDSGIPGTRGREGRQPPRTERRSGSAEDHGCRTSYDRPTKLSMTQTFNFRLGTFDFEASAHQARTRTHKTQSTETRDLEIQLRPDRWWARQHVPVARLGEATMLQLFRVCGDLHRIRQNGKAAGLDDVTAR